MAGKPLGARRFDTGNDRAAYLQQKYVKGDFMNNIDEFFIVSGVAKLGNFVLKDGSVSDVFFDFGNIAYGQQLEKLGGLFADLMMENGLNDTDVIVGPSYKGINLAAATSIMLCRNYGIDIPFAYNRK